MSEHKTFDCVVAGTCVLDILVKPVDLETPIGGNRLFEVGPIETAAGGLVCNAGTAMARLGCRVAALTCVGDDLWADSLRRMLESESIDVSAVATRRQDVTSTTAVLISPTAERSFAHHPGACAKLDRNLMEQHRSLIGRSRLLLLGYYSLLPHLEADLPELLQEVRDMGCRVAMDAGGTGGGIEPLDEILPYVDFYVPSRTEAEHQTGERDPERMIRRFRDAGAVGVVGLKLGTEGALLNHPNGEWFRVACAEPPGAIVDTTGAGDAFLGGLLAGWLGGSALRESAQLAAATAACCVTGHGATAGLRNFEATARVAGWS